MSPHRNILCVSSYVQRISFSWANTASYSIGSSAEESFLTYFLLGKYTLMIKTGLLAWTSMILYPGDLSSSSIFCRIFRHPNIHVVGQQGRLDHGHLLLYYNICELRIHHSKSPAQKKNNQCSCMHSMSVAFSNC